VSGFFKSAVLGIVCFALGVAATLYYDTHRAVADNAKPAAAIQPAAPDPELAFASIKFAEEPLWAYGFDRPPLPGEKAAPQNPPPGDAAPSGCP